MTLQGLSAYCSLNLGGLNLVEYVPVEWVNAANWEKLVSDAWNFQVAVSLSSGSWLSMPLLNSQRVWDERKLRTDQGVHYEQVISGIVPNLRPEASGELALMEEHRFLARITDRNGNKWLIGTLDNPLEFKSEATSGESRGSVNSYRVQFTAQTLRRAYGYVPVA